ncbi:MAG TPA: alkaline phosphatase family protein, partial [Acidimicrobiia bacterium]|nr:alkaline phosphatase family protein [Acidimicrobiia bacterium]
MPERAPDYAGGSLLNLVAELEHRLIGTTPAAPLHAPLANLIPEARSYVLVLFDGLGDLQLDHRQAEPLRASRRGAIDAPFPTTTTVSLATIATGRSPAEHGLIAYQLWIPETERVVGTIKWTTLWGEQVEVDHAGFLPGPNLWERLVSKGVEPITVQPWNFQGTPLSRVLYRGCRWEPWSDESDAVEAACQLAAEPGRLVFLYLPHVDFAAHVTGQASQAYADAMRIVARAWERLGQRLPDGAVAIGTADHGHVDVPETRRIRIDKADHEGRIFSGDSRALFVHGEGRSLAERLPARWVPRAEMDDWWGPGVRHGAFDGRAPDGVLL